MLVKQLGTLNAFPGIYGYPIRERLGKHLRLVSLRAALELAIRVHGSKQEMEKTARARRKEAGKRYRRALAKWNERIDLIAARARERNSSRVGKRMKGQPDPPAGTRRDAILRRDVRPLALHGATAFPFWDARRQSLEVGIYCSVGAFAPGSVYLWPDDAETHSHRAYVMAEIARHFLECEALRMEKENNARWKHSKVRFSSRPLSPIPDGKEFLVDENGHVVFESASKGRKRR